MKILANTSRNEYAYIKNNVVYGIKKTEDENDTCCSAITSANCPTITVTYTRLDNTIEEKTYYLDVYMSEGDLVNGDKFVPNDDHKLNYKGEKFNSYIELYKEEAIEYVVSQMEKGSEFDKVIKNLPLYLQYESNVEFSGNTTYKKFTTSDITPIKQNSDEFVDYVKFLAKKRGVECVNETLKFIEKEINEDDIKIE